MTWTAPVVTRVDEPFAADERTMLEGWLSWQRSTLLYKCEGLTGDQLAIQAVPPSKLSLLGLIRHLADAERSWFRIRFAGEKVAMTHVVNGDSDPAFDDVDPARAEADYDALVAEWKHATGQSPARVSKRLMSVTASAACHCVGSTSI